MVENYNSINTGRIISPNQELNRGQKSGASEQGDFKNLLMKSIDEVNRLQAEADQATVNLTTGKTNNVAEVFTAINKAEIAFKTLMQIRNKLMEAYDEVKQMRV
ncbi:MAG: flagellar hook-basal body complex protein FliE [Sedimentisphaerales bacterium]|nr:flagellar hook-basal body complex protein FliE [Sedimentisphaerales bacterium]